MKHIRTLLVLTGTVLMCIVLLSLNAGQNEMVQHTVIGASTKAVDLSKDYYFAGERVPIDNKDVLERLDRELLSNGYASATILLNLKLANRYFPLIEKILAENNIPEDFKFLAVAESNFRNGTSTAGAKGFWQFMPATARSYGLELNGSIDERMNVEKATYAACRLINIYKQKFGSWTLAAAAYNTGEGKIETALKSQEVENYYDLDLYQETLRYIFRILAFKEIMSHPEKFGYQLEDHELYSPLHETVTQTEINYTVNNLTPFAKSLGTTVRQIKLYNPWILGNTIPNSSGKIYTVKYPKTS